MLFEARNPSGELYGFEGTRAFSGDSPQQVAHAAQSHGQEDYILTLTFAPAGVIHA